MNNNENTAPAPTTVTFRESFPTLRLGETRRAYQVRVTGYNDRRASFVAVADANGWTVTNR